MTLKEIEVTFHHRELADLVEAMDVEFDYVGGLIAALEHVIGRGCGPNDFDAIGVARLAYVHHERMFAIKERMAALHRKSEGRARRVQPA